MNRRLKCFVAMAFGRDDCDLLYSQQIVPALRALKLNPIRVDRRQHRDDLNNFIIRMLKDADIVLANLTYARPSVYYEAGFAERASPIVYTVRSDHLSRTLPDDRLWVHFDLGMKKIVAWKSPKDPSFAARLRARMTYLLQPILADRALRDRRKAEKQKFAKLSITTRCKMIEHQFTKELRRKRFWLKPLADIDPTTAHYQLNGVSATFAAKMVGDTALSATVVAAESITKKQIETVLHMAIGSRLIAPQQRAKILRFDEHVYLCAMSAIPTLRLTATLPDVTPAGTVGHFRLSLPASKRHTTIWLLGGLESERMAKEAAQRSTQHLSDQKANKYTSIAREGYYRQGVVFERPKKPHDSVYRIASSRPARTR